ncbi:DNA polymerase III subunit gamma/tau [Anaerococcus tetradius]|uniref:DNA-directed DNA polymerase n=1 Tax=Anaerococcus tetradius ATCC 35098 TaxID=525255 RepID=C2CG31_9FIRM|nr:DNA polymerase III subunit gamma/tau [Anaerococcus tetradius]EEI83436.1 DNA polymerase III, subunit gamma and tau [Anaerococcus tetradius ATCC 35098]
MAKALYRQYRPKTFDQVLGQDRVVNVLKNQVKNKNFSHAYIFAGERGCGKTTCAKIFAKAINCLHPVDGSPCLECENCKAIDEESTIDIIEMDAASNRRIDDIRNLKDNVIYPPNKLRYKVYIIDEAHMITREAFNALLKIMEEPPSHLVFILATTEIDKIPNTILSRAQNFEFNKIEAKKIKEQINLILEDKNIVMENEAIDLIIRKASGAMRDALSILDQVLSFDKAKFTLAEVENLLGVVDFFEIDKLTSSIISYNQSESLSYVFSLRENNKSNKDILDSLTFYLRDIMIYKMTGDDRLFENEERADFIKKRAAELEIDRLLDMLDILSDYSNKLRSADNTDLIIELMLVRLITSKDIKSIDSRLRALEESKDDDIVSIINKLVDDKLAKIDLDEIKSVEARDTIGKFNINKVDEDNKAIDKNYEIINNEKLNEVIESNDSAKEEKHSPIDNESSDFSSSIELAPRVIDDIRAMIIKTAGRMLKAMFESDGFNYIYKKGNFTLYLKDDFYGIFIQTKTEDIRSQLNEILDEDLVFSIDNYSNIEKNKEKKTSSLANDHKNNKDIEVRANDLENKINHKKETNKEPSNIDRLKEIFKEELIIK